MSNLNDLNSPGVYMLCFNGRVRESERSAGSGHYVGQSIHTINRLSQHLSGKSRAARVVKAALKAGLDVRVARVWPVDGPPSELARHERIIKNRKEGPTLCPFCSGGHHRLIKTRSGEWFDELAAEVVADIDAAVRPR